MFGAICSAAMFAIQYEAEIARKARESLSPEAYKEWRAERIAANRHSELCRAIENSRPRGFGFFW